MANCPTSCNGFRFRTRKRLTNAISVSALLFQGPFQAIPVQTEEYLLHLSRYQHLNPVFAGWYSGRRTGIFRVIEIIWEYDKEHWCGRKWCYRSFRPGALFRSLLRLIGLWMGKGFRTWWLNR